MGATVGVKMQAFNWRLWQARREMGLTQAHLGLLTGMPALRLSNIETLKSRPTAEEQDEIASALDVAVTEMFPPEVLDLYGPAASTVRFAVPAARLRELRDAGRAADPALLVSGLPEQVDDVVGMLSAREQEVIRRRFGLAGGDQQTLEAVGKVLEVDRERVRQIEAKALRHLRHPSRSKKIRDYLDSDDTRVSQGEAPKVGPKLKAQREAAVRQQQQAAKTERLRESARAKIARDVDEGRVYVVDPVEVRAWWDPLERYINACFQGVPGA